MKINTCKISHNYLHGARYERREEMVEIDIDNGKFEIVCPPDYSPHHRAGVKGIWKEVFRRTKTGETIWRNQPK